MLLVDTSVWIDHFRKEDANLLHHLRNWNVLVHPFVLGELALGHFRQRILVLDRLRGLQKITVSPDEEVVQLIEDQSFYGLGIGYVDVHLLAAARMLPGTLVWTRDKRLAAAASKLQLNANLP
ncbi:type II toxin-antitoxin system VapC family toxin [Phyllobacterium leguminum]|uniref:type II toxin-antitoxin system VapC family toxin n=1 Tax=Phyllobacterium leguminum TaxID=314237 RepID=UPI000DA18180|nr:type II toxin-antitoxin system VapC family toxin [Phyllobacterium leguminum]